MPRRKPAHKRHGVVLLEVIVALTIFGTAALTAVVLVHQASDTVEHVRDTDARTRAASAFLDVVSLWPREDLDRHLGDHPQGEWLLHVHRPTPTLYIVGLYDSTATRPLLETALFRPEVPNAVP